MRKFLCAGISVLAITYAETTTANIPLIRPADHAPIGVMGDHLHKKGEWMVGYRYAQSSTSGYRSASRSLSNADVMHQYGEAATEMDMGMHMFEVMYGITDNFNIMIMPQYMQMEMLHKSSHGHGHSHEHSIEGFGDTDVVGLYSIFRRKNGEYNHKAHINFGISLPTGAIDKTFTDHHHNVYNLPYSMQFGSGTYDPVIGLTYTGKSTDWSWGAQTLNYIRLGKNNNGYRQGNKYTANTWVAKNIGKSVSASLRLEGEAWNNVSGLDKSLPRTAIAGADPDEVAGRRIRAHAGLNLLGGESHGLLSKHRLAVEVGAPIYQHYSGAQPDEKYRFTVGWQFAF